MRAQFDVLSGARAGAVLFFGGDAVTVGRHPDSDIQFHPQRDLAVSTHHALLFCRSGLWHVRDLASRNGTFVNQVRISGDRPLVPGNRIRFGHGGPEVEFRYAPLITPSVEMAVVANHQGEHRIPGPPSVGRVLPENGTSEQLRVQLTRETRRLRWMAAALSLLIVVLAVGFFTAARNRAAPPTGPVQPQGEQPVAPAPGGGEAPAPAEPLLQSGGVEGVGVSPPPPPAPTSTAPPASAPPGGTDAPPYSAQPLPQGPPPDPVQASREAVARFQATHAMDLQRVQGLNRRAVARLYVEADDGSVVTGTGFAVRVNGTLVTNRHVLEGEGGGRVARIGVQFADSEQVWPARFLIASPGSDLALVKVDNIIGDVPVVAPLNLRPDTLRPGIPLAVLGFPLGGDAALPGEGGGTIIRPLLTPGVLEASGSGELVVQGYGATGASGSPVMDQTGAVVGVLFGGRGEGEEHRLLAVAAPELQRLLEALPDASGR